MFYTTLQNPVSIPEKALQEDEKVEDPDTDDGPLAEVEGEEGPPLPPLQLASMSVSLLASTPSPLVRNLIYICHEEYTVCQLF